jgi:hypothetical protein
MEAREVLGREIAERSLTRPLEEPGSPRVRSADRGDGGWPRLYAKSRASQVGQRLVQWENAALVAARPRAVVRAVSPQAMELVLIGGAGDCLAMPHAVCFAEVVN